MELWYTERQADGVALSCKVIQTLHSEQTPFQRLDVIETAQYGRMLVLDGMVQTTEADEFVYHEMIVHVAMQTHPGPKRVAVVGGGDGGTVREVLKYRSVESVKLIEIDARVVEASRRFFPELSKGLDDPRVECLYVDGIRHIEKSKNAYDVVIVDSTEPVGPAVGLFSRKFYVSCYESLTDQGILVAQTESPFFNRDLLEKAYSAIYQVFPISRLYLASVPTYPSGLWSFSLGSKGRDPLEVTPDLDGISTRYYTEGIHQAAFHLPRFVQEIVARATKGGE